MIGNSGRLGSIRQLQALAIVLIIGLLLGLPTDARGHAELESSSPPADGTVTALPAELVLTFTEEVRPGSVIVQVTGPNGERVDAGNAEVDLNDPERATVRVSLYAGGPGEYSVHWETVSNTDGDSASGDFTFTVSAQQAPSPEYSVGTPDAATITPEPTPTLENFGNPLAGTEGDYDGRAFAISVGAGLLALVVIVGFWFAVRPRNPKFGPRAGKGAR